MIHNFLKPIIYSVFLSCSCFLIAYFLGWLTDDLVFRKVIWFIAVVLDCFLQYMWWLSLTTKIKRLKYILWFCCLLYMFYAVPSAIGFFNAEMKTKENHIQVQDFKQKKIKNRLDQIEKELNPISTYKETEAKTGYATRSKAIKTDKDDLVAEQERLLSSLDNVSNNSSNNTKGSPFEGFGNWKNFFKNMIFGLTVFFIYFGEFLIIWDMVKEYEEKAKSSEDNSNPTVNKPLEVGPEDVTQKNETDKSNIVTDNETSRKKCLSCLKKFIPKRSDQVYCNDNCRVKAFRLNNKHIGDGLNG